MEQLVTSDFKLGIIAGGQLGKMLALAASNWDLKTYILDPDENCPASAICTNYTKGDYSDYSTVYNFGKKVNMITFDIENINTEALIQLKKEGKLIFPEPEIMELIKDKGLQKQFYLDNGIPSPSFQLFSGKDKILDSLEKGEIQFPFVQKLRTAGYDGRGVEIIKSNLDLQRLMEGPSLVEAKVNVKKELSVIIARNRKGDVKSFPLVEMEFNQEANLVERLICPADVSEDTSRNAQLLAEKIISNLKMTGLLAVELFLNESGELYVNEVAPRPHNSGHHTIESCITSQYEQHLRSILGFDLGSTEIKIPSVMINLLGEKDEYGLVRYEGLTESMGIDGVKIHIYGKNETRPYRKMGHVTILDKSIEEAKIKAKRVNATLKVKSWKQKK